VYKIQNVHTTQPWIMYRVVRKVLKINYSAIDHVQGA